MLHIFLGENESETRVEAKRFAKDLILDASNKVNEIDVDSPVLFDELILSQSLFGGTFVYFIDLFGKNKETMSQFEENFEKFVDSKNIFVISLLDFVGKNKKIFLHNVDSKKTDKKEISIFSLSDAIAKKDKKNAWLLYRSFLDRGMSPEEIHGTIFWQIKSLALAKVSNDAISAKMKPFVFSKAKGFLENFKDGEVENWLSRLVEIYHKSHRGEYKLENALEVFILGV